MGNGVLGSGQTDSSSSSERTEAESLSTEDSSIGESPVAWIKPQMQNQVPSRLRMQHIPPDSPDLCRIPCCCGGQPSATMTTTEIPFKDPRTYEGEETCPVLMVSGRSYPQPEGHQGFPLHVSEGVWMTYPVSNPQTTDVSEDPEWTRRRVVAVEQQQWNRYLAATGQTSHVVPHFGSITPTFTMCHVQPKPDIIPTRAQQEPVSTTTSSVTASNCTVSSNSLTDTRNSLNPVTDNPTMKTGEVLVTKTVSNSPKAQTVITISPSLDSPSARQGDVDGYEETLVLRPSFVKWIVLPPDLSRGLQPVARLIPRWDSSLVGAASGGLKSGLLDELLAQTTSCPDFTLQRFNF